MKALDLRKIQNCESLVISLLLLISCGNKTKTKTIVVGTDGDYKSISEAVSKASYGDTIFVKTGIYEESIHMWGGYYHIIGESRENTILKNGTGNYKSPPLEANMGSISNMTIIADNYNPTISNPVEFHDLPSYGIHIESGNEQPYSLVINNCVVVSKWNAAIGIGCRYNQKILIKNCYLVTECIRTWSKTTNEWINQGAIFFHNDAVVSDREGGELYIEGNTIEGVNAALSCLSVENGSKMKVYFSKNNFYVKDNSSIVYNRNQFTDKGCITGSCILCDTIW